MNSSKSYLILTINEHFNDIVAQEITILVQEALDIVDDLASVVFYAKLGREHAWLAVQRIRVVDKVHLLHKRVVCCSGKVTLVV